MSETKFTPGQWKVRVRESDGRIVDCFVSANDVNGFPYDAEIMGDDEYGHIEDDMDRKLADANLIAAAPDLYEALEEALRVIGDHEYPITAKIMAKALSKARGET